MAKRVLIIDDNKELVESMKMYFGKSDIVNVVGCAYNGKDGCELIREHENDIDIVLLDLIMPKEDGFYVLNNMKNEGIHKTIIVLTSYEESEIIEELSNFSIRYILIKPFDFEELEKKISNININVSNNKKIDSSITSLEKHITRILHNLGIPSNVKGYNYVRDAIGLIYNDPSLVGCVTKVLYPEIAIKYQTTVSRVERAIRHAIEISWIRGDWDVMEEIFGHSVDIDRSKPTNSEFIVTIADKLRLDTINV